MTEPSQTELRSWARAQGMTVKDRGSLPQAVRQAYLDARDGSTSSPADADPHSELVAPLVPVVPVDATDPGRSDLAGGLRAYLASLDAEVEAVSSLSERIDAHVTELNVLREQQSQRLLGLDELRQSVQDSSLSAFLNKTLRPRMAVVEEIVPDRLQP